MKRNQFLKKGILGLGTIVAVPTVISSCSKDDSTNIDNPNCPRSPEETEGPFPIKTPAQLVRENIIGNRAGVPMMINITVQDSSTDCTPIEGALVDIWHCDAQGNYSEYAGQVDGDFTNENFLRGRQTTNANGLASFISIFPGWYPGRTPHIHIEVLSATGASLLVSQISWPESISSTVYATSEYNGNQDTTNASDGIVDDANLADSLTGNTTDGYVLSKVITV